MPDAMVANESSGAASREKSVRAFIHWLLWLHYAAGQHLRKSRNIDGIYLIF
jgi:hypothetical protein